uniref:Interleukin 21 receptor, tandem duplicate 2 n=1 Tax=Astyanax mexicanus TaxID=7994 RepID=A0A3B1KK05_ASTMX
MLFTFPTWRMALRSLQPINPHNLTLEVVNRSYHFKWVSGYEEHTYESSLPRLYKFFYHKEQQDTVSLVNKLLCSIPEHDLEAGIRYVSWVCTEISNQNNDYKGVGSSCSSPITWSTTPTGIYRDNFNTAVINRIKKVTWVATPSPFFQPLFHNHQGNFKVRMEDLEPPEPETTAPKPAAFPQNYCTLTNTPTGLIPTLTTGPSGPELTTEASEHALNLQIQENTDELVPLSLDSLQLSMD